MPNLKDSIQTVMRLLQDREKKLADLRKEIRGVLEHEMHGPEEEDEAQFLTYEQLDEIWIHRGHPNSYLEQFSKILKLKGSEKERVRQNHLRIISTLVWIRFDQWTEYFMKEFVPYEKSRDDSNLPFSEGDLQQAVFDFAKNFFRDQFRFLPIKIHEMEPATYLRASEEKQPEHQRSRMPFLKKEVQEPMHERIGIKVTKETIAANHMVKKNGRPISKAKVMAVKSFPAARFNDFQQEKQNLELLKDSVKPNPNILFSFAAVQVGRNNDSAIGYIISDLADCNLHELLFGLCDGFRIRKREFTPFSILSEIKGVASAVQWLHAGVRKSSTRELVRCTHMDLKPSNILIFWEDPDEVRWKISDFGISVVRHVDHMDPGDKTLTFTRARQYPAEYQAPEVEFHNNEVGSPSDVWSFGCILMEVVAFIIGGPSSVLHLQKLRNEEDPNYFYSYSKEGVFVKPQILLWLQENEKSTTWIPELLILIKSILEIDYEDRPRSQGIFESLGGIIDKYEESGIHGRCSWTSEPKPRTNPDEFLSLPVTESTRSLETRSSEMIPSHLELKVKPAVKSCYIDKFGSGAVRSRMSLEGEWVMFRTAEFAYAVAIQSLPWGEGWVPFKSIEQQGILLRQNSYKIEAIAAAGEFVAALLYPSDPQNVNDKKIQVRGRETWDFNLTAPASGICVSKKGDCLIHRDDGKLVLCRRDSGTRDLKLDGYTLRAATFSHDGSSVYAWSRSDGLDHWQIWEFESENGSKSCSAKFERDTYRGGKKNVLVPWCGRSAFSGFEPRFLTIDMLGNGSVIGDEGGKLGRLQFARKYDGIVHGCLTPSGTSVVFIRRAHLNGSPGFVLLDLAPSISKDWQPNMREIEISSSFIDLYDHHSDDFILKESGSQITAYLSGPTSKYNKAVVVREAVIAPP